MNTLIRHSLLLACCLLVSSRPALAQPQPDSYALAENYARVTAQLVVTRQELAVALRSIEAIDSRMEELKQDPSTTALELRKMEEYRVSALALADETARQIDVLERELVRLRPQSRSVAAATDPYTAFSEALLVMFSDGIDIAELSMHEDFPSEQQQQVPATSAEDAFWAEVGKFMDLIEDTRAQRIAAQRVTRNSAAQQEILDQMVQIREQADDQREALYTALVAQYSILSARFGIKMSPPPPPGRSTPGIHSSNPGNNSPPPPSGQTEEQATKAMAENLRKIAETEEDEEIRKELLRQADDLEKGGT